MTYTYILIAVVAHCTISWFAWKLATKGPYIYFDRAKCQYIRYNNDNSALVLCCSPIINVAACYAIWLDTKAHQAEILKDITIIRDE